MTAEETTFFNRVKDWLGVGVNERVLMQVVKVVDAVILMPLSREYFIMQIVSLST